MMTYLFINEFSKDVNFTTAFRYLTVRRLVIILALIIILVVICVVMYGVRAKLVIAT